MKNLKIHKREVTIVSYVNHKGERIVLPLYYSRGRWHTFGSYQAYGVSKSDPQFSSVHGLPIGWRPTGRLLMALRKAADQKVKAVLLKAK